MHTVRFVVLRSNARRGHVAHPVWSRVHAGRQWFFISGRPERAESCFGNSRAATSRNLVDYGCGNGELLVEAKRIGWQAFGVELDAEVAHKTQANTGCRIFTDPNNAADFPQADVLHLGDVIEHLTKLDEQFPEVLELIKPGGLLLAQGPLENNASLFTFAVASVRKLRRPRRTEMAPYHVLLATSHGQREFFRRFGLEELEYKLREVSWPAPVELALSDLKNPRTVAMFGLRSLSKAVSALRPSKWGNRYFYAGEKPTVKASERKGKWL